MSSFKDVLQEYIDVKGFGSKKIADLSGIPERYIIALIEENASDLPPAPYVRGYIGKLSEILEFDKEELWRLYKKEFNLNGSSGSLDQLPNNRYAVKRFNKKTIISAALGLLVIIYLTWNFNKIVGAPLLEITYPRSENLIVADALISIEGKTDNGGKLIINEVEIFVDEDGRFQKDYLLEPGLNTIKIKAKKFLGKEINITKQIVYQPPAPATDEVNQQPPAIQQDKK